MRRFCAFVLLFLFLQHFVSCQKQLSFDDPAIPGGDSVTLVKTIRAVNYDTSDLFDWEERQTFNYDKSLNRTIVNLFDSGINIPNQLQQWTETFQYDDQNRLSQFSSTAAYEPATKIDFNYNSSGDISKTSIQDQWLGKTIDCYFNSTMQNGDKIITMYDTSGLYATNSDTRPQITKYIFDAASRLVHETIYYTLFKHPQNRYEDTTEIKLSYDNNNYVNTQITNDAYRFSPNDPLTVYTRDSSVYTREGINTEIRNSFLAVYRNMYWFGISEYSDGFANALNLGAATYSGPAVKTGESWEFSPPDPAVHDHITGIFQNTFDTNGLLIKAVYPKKFANKYGGKTEIFYTYVKVKK